MLSKEFLNICAESNIPVALIGAKKEILEKAIENFRRTEGKTLILLLNKTLQPI